MATSDVELLDSAQRKVNRARSGDLLDVILTLDEVHAILHARRASWCSLIEPHDSHHRLHEGRREWCHPE